MKLKKIRLKLEALVNSEGNKRRKKIHKIEELLEKLKQREKKLKKRFAAFDTNAGRKAIAEELEIVHKQQRKGRQALKELDTSSKFGQTDK